jgi:hypothetical protein
LLSSVSIVSFYGSHYLSFGIVGLEEIFNAMLLNSFWLFFQFCQLNVIDILNIEIWWPLQAIVSIEPRINISLLKLVRHEFNQFLSDDLLSQFDGFTRDSTLMNSFTCFDIFALVILGISNFIDIRWMQNDNFHFSMSHFPSVIEKLRSKIQKLLEMRDIELSLGSLLNHFLEVCECG